MLTTQHRYEESANIVKITKVNTNFIYEEYADGTLLYNRSGISLASLLE